MSNALPTPPYTKAAKQKIALDLIRHSNVRAIIQLEASSVSRA